MLQLIAAYRNRGHQKARLDPLGLMQREAVPDLDLSAHGLSRADFNTVFQTGNLAINKSEATLGEMVEVMEATYCGSMARNTCILSTPPKSAGFSSVWKACAANRPCRRKPASISWSV